MNYYYQLELLAGLFVMSSFLIAGALWSIVHEMYKRRVQLRAQFHVKHLNPIEYGFINQADL